MPWRLGNGTVTTFVGEAAKSTDQDLAGAAAGGEGAAADGGPAGVEADADPVPGALVALSPELALVAAGALAPPSPLAAAGFTEP